MAPATPRLTGVRKAAALLLPWLFLVVFATLFLNLLWPRAVAGHLLAMLMVAFVSLVFVSFTVAAITFSRDVLADRYP